MTTLFRNPDDVFAKTVMSRTYCREDPEKGRKETPDEVFTRVLDAFEKYYKNTLVLCQRDLYDREKWFDMMSQGIALPAGRMLWSMGSTTIDKEGYLPMMNCSFVIVDDPLEPIRYISKMLFLGCGVGFSLERKYFKTLQEKFERIRIRAGYDQQFGEILRDDAERAAYTVEDSREGWTSFLVSVINAAIRQAPFLYSLAKIRPKGQFIKGFGGRSGDPEILGSVAEKMYNMVLKSRGATLELYYDLICLVAKLVVSGNVRRSALMAIGDPDDKEFLGLKDFSKMGHGTSHRSFCNNSVKVDSFEQLGPDFWRTFHGNSEAYGWVNTEKCYIQYDGYRRHHPVGFNPCGEQPLASYEVCCLGEVNLAKVADNPALFMEAAKMVYLFCKLSYTLGAPTEPKTDKICQDNQRIGVSLTGVAMVHNSPELWLLLEEVRDMLREFDQEISVMLGVNPSVALTTIKPGGTLPKIAGAPGPGVHRPISRYQIRRVRFPGTSSLLRWLKSMGIPIEPEFDPSGKPTEEGTMVASFYLDNKEPYDGKFSDYQITRAGLRDMFQRVAKVQEHWSENSVSVTIYFKLEDVESELIPLVKEYFPCLKCFSGLPYYGHNFVQAPEEPISRDQYEHYLKNVFYRSWTNLPTVLDGNEEPEDFGSCGERGSCSDR